MRVLPKFANAAGGSRRRLPAIGSWLAAILIGLALSHPAVAAEGPFDDLAGSWSGTGTIALKNGTKERIRCKADYDVVTRSNVRLQITCASDSYKFELQSSIHATDNQLSGNWMEMSRRVAGKIEGRVSGSRINARAAGDTFTALLSMTTRGSSQSVSITSPGSEMERIGITLSRRSR